MIDIACRMDPYNQEYRSAREQIRKQTESFGSNYRTANDDLNTTCNICSMLICADCCCECMGGDLIRCC